LSIELSPDSAAPDEQVKITTKGFDPKKGPITVKFAGKSAKKPMAISDSIITVVVPPGAKSGNVEVTVDKSAVKPFTVKPPEYDKSHFEVLTGVGAVLAGKEYTSYKTDNDAVAATNIGGKTPEILLGGGFILPWHWGGRWIENSYCSDAKDRQDAKDKEKGPTVPDDCQPGGAYNYYRPWETFVSVRFAPASDQTINGFVLGGLPLVFALRPHRL
jgi:hypothetical protein